MSKGKGHVPIRTCSACGAKRPKKEMIRLVLDGEGQWVSDFPQRMQGRGAYLCREESCREKWSQNKRMNRLFGKGKAVSVDLKPRADCMKTASEAAERLADREE